MGRSWVISHTGGRSLEWNESFGRTRGRCCEIYFTFDNLVYDYNLRLVDFRHRAMAAPIPSNASSRLVLNISGRNVLSEMRLASLAREPQVPWDNVCLDSMSEPAGVRNSADDVLRLFKRIVDPLSSEILVRVKSLFHGVGLALLHPSREATGEEDSVFEDDTGALTLRWHGMLSKRQQRIVSGNSIKLTAASPRSMTRSVDHLPCFESVKTGQR